MSVNPPLREVVRQMWPKQQPRTKRAKKAKASCMVDGCEKPTIARGWCSMHYERWRKSGLTDPYRSATMVCSVDQCERSTRSTYAEHCEMHYYRLRRTGSTADPEHLRGVCAAAGCDREDITRTTYCQMHADRLRKRGDVEFEFKGSASPHWTGEDATNRAVHQRIRAAHGSASQHCCVDCGGNAKHWSYDHADPDERTEEGVGPYSTDIEHYQPRCVKCHKRFDMAIVMAKPTWRLSQRKVRKITRERARDRCERCGQRRAHSLHHLKNRSQGGEWSPQNCVWLCGDGIRGCHGWVTANPNAAWEEGFHVRPWETPGGRPIHSGVHGVVLLADDGGVLPIEGAAS